MGIKECTCDEHRVMYGSVESGMNCTPETNITHCTLTNWNLNKNLKNILAGDYKHTYL